MAVIKGYEVKELKQLEGSRGVSFTANIYLNNKKIGTVENKGVGGATDLMLDKGTYPQFEKVGGDYFKGKGETGGDADEFIEELISLKELEDDYKQAIRKGYGSIVYLRDRAGGEGNLKMPVVKNVPKDYKGNLNEEGYDKVDEYKSINDFTIN